MTSPDSAGQSARRQAGLGQKTPASWWKRRQVRSEWSGQPARGVALLTETPCCVAILLTRRGKRPRTSGLMTSGS
eukprot:scaffold7227_cov34-Prasinocladus_malaysianus.AAC.1